MAVSDALHTVRRPLGKAETRRALAFLLHQWQGQGQRQSCRATYQRRTVASRKRTAVLRTSEERKDFLRRWEQQQEQQQPRGMETVDAPIRMAALAVQPTAARAARGTAVIAVVVPTAAVAAGVGVGSGVETELSRRDQ